MVRTRQLTAPSGLDLIADVWGEATPRPPVLLVHGVAQTRRSWRRTADRLAAAGVQAIAVDLRGHGDSGWAPDEDYRLDRMIEDLVAWAQLLPAPPVIVGASLGGLIALTAAGERPGLAAGLVLVDAVIDPVPDGVDRIRAFLDSAPHGFASLDEAAEAIAAYRSDRARPASADGLRRNLRRHDDGRWYWHWDPSLMRPENARTRIDVERLAAAAAQITVPTLIVRGVQSDVVSPDGVRRLRHLIPHAEVFEVPADHMIAGDDNDVFAAGLDGFLSGLESFNEQHLRFENQTTGW